MNKSIIEWLVIIYDKPVNQRLKFRAEHLKRIPALFDKQVITNCGPIFKDKQQTQFIGSAFNIRASSEEEVLNILKDDIYYKQDVWDIKNVIIHPYNVVKRFGKN